MFAKIIYSLATTISALDNLWKISRSKKITRYTVLFCMLPQFKFVHFEEEKLILHKNTVNLI